MGIEQLHIVVWQDAIAEKSFAPFKQGTPSCCALRPTMGRFQGVRKDYEAAAPKDGRPCFSSATFGIGTEPFYWAAFTLTGE
jgi:hypothetical protein